MLDFANLVDKRMANHTVDTGMEARSGKHCRRIIFQSCSAKPWLPNPDSTIAYQSYSPYSPMLQSLLWKVPLQVIANSGAQLIT